MTGYLRRNWPELLFFMLLTPLFALKASRAFSLPIIDFGISEWLISYDAGFVRRGLAGSALRLLMHVTGLDLYTLIIGITGFAYAFVCLAFVRQIRRVAAPGTERWRLVLLLSPALVLFGVSGGWFYRKDALTVACTLVNLLTSEHFIRRARNGPALPLRYAGWTLLSVGLPALLLALLHEGMFVFLYLPANLIVSCGTVSYLQSRAGAGTAAANRRPHYVALCAFLPAVVAAVLSGYFHGDAKGAWLICQSWASTYPAIDCQHDMPASIEGSGWTVWQIVPLSLKTINDGSCSWYLLAFFALICVHLAALSKLAKPSMLAAAQPLMLILLIAAVPMFVIATDWGRYFSVLAIQSMFLALSDEAQEAVHASLKVVARFGIVRRLVSFPLQPAIGFFSRRPMVICAVFLCLGLPPVEMTLRTAMAQSPLSVLIHVFKPSFFSPGR